MSDLFINLSNHPSSMWGEKQKKAARGFGEIVDIPFPQVPASASETEITALADKYFEKVRALAPACVMCAGEFCLCYKLFSRFIDAGIKTVTACSERVAVEKTAADGTTHKEVTFDFVQFREIK